MEEIDPEAKLEDIFTQEQRHLGAQFLERVLVYFEDIESPPPNDIKEAILNRLEKLGNMKFLLRNSMTIIAAQLLTTNLTGTLLQQWQKLQNDEINIAQDPRILLQSFQAEISKENPNYQQISIEAEEVYERYFILIARAAHFNSKRIVKQNQRRAHQWNNDHINEPKLAIPPPVQIESYDCTILGIGNELENQINRAQFLHKALMRRISDFRRLYLPYAHLHEAREALQQFQKIGEDVRKTYLRIPNVTSSMQAERVPDVDVIEALSEVMKVQQIMFENFLDVVETAEDYDPWLQHAVSTMEVGGLIKTQAELKAAASGNIENLPRALPNDGQMSSAITAEKEFPITAKSDFPMKAEKEFPITTESDFPMIAEKEFPITTESDFPMTAEKEFPITTESDFPMTAEKEFRISRKRLSSVGRKRIPQHIRKRLSSVGRKRIPQHARKRHSSDRRK